MRTVDEFFNKLYLNSSWLNDFVQIFIQAYVFMLKFKKWKTWKKTLFKEKS